MNSIGKIKEILDKQEFEVNEPPLNREEVVEELETLCKDRKRKALKGFTEWAYRNQYAIDLELVEKYLQQEEKNE